MTRPAHLHLIDPETGEVTEQACPSCQQLEDKLKGAERDLNTWRARFAELSRDKWAEAQQSKYWPFAVEVFEYWRERCNHPNSAWTLDRYLLIEPFLKQRKYGKTLEDRRDLCKRAIDGYAYDCFVTTRRNGTKRRHDGIDLIFRDAAHFEEGCNRAERKAA